MASDEEQQKTFFQKLKDEVVSPATLLHLVPFIGWPSLFLDMYQGWGALGKGAEIALHAAPGLAQGDSVGNALMADYGTRLKIAAGVMLAPVLAAASPAAQGVLGGAAAQGVLGGAAAQIDVDPKVIDDAVDAARKELGLERVQKLIAQAAQAADQSINQPFTRLVSDEGLRNTITPTVIGLTGLPPLQALESLHLDALSLSKRFNVREDVAAMAINSLLHQHVYGVSSANFDPATGARVFAPQAGRADGKNSAWALVDLLDAQGRGAPPEQIQSLKDDYERARRVDEQPIMTLKPGDILTEILHAQQRDAPPDYIRDLEEKFDVASGLSPRGHALARRLREEELTKGAKLGHLTFETPPGISFRSAVRAPVVAPPSASAPPVIRGIGAGPSAREDGILRRAGTLALLTSPFWLLLLLSRSRTR